MAKKKSSIIKRGTDHIPSGGGSSKWFKIGAGEKKVVVPLVSLKELISIERYELWEFNPFIAFPAIGEGDPGKEIGAESRWKGFLPVFVKGDSEAPVQIWSFGPMIGRQLDEIEQAMREEGEDGIKGLVLHHSRRGSGFNTEYSTVSLGKRIDVTPYEDQIPDIEAEIGPFTREEIIQLFVDRGIDFDSLVREHRASIAADREAAAAAEAEAKSVTAPPAKKVAEDEIDWEDL